jgi:hypothetical protein
LHAGEDQGVWGEAGAALGDECEQSAHQLGWDVDCALRFAGLERHMSAVAIELVLDANERGARGRGPRR